MFQIEESRDSLSYPYSTTKEMFNKISIRSNLKSKQFFTLLNQMLPFQVYFRRNTKSFKLLFLLTLERKAKEKFCDICLQYIKFGHSEKATKI